MRYISVNYDSNIVPPFQHVARATNAEGKSSPVCIIAYKPIQMCVMSLHTQAQIKYAYKGTLANIVLLGINSTTKIGKLSLSCSNLLPLSF
jgi:hypothetical protein